MIDRIFKLTMSFAIIFMVASIVAARATNSSNSMEPMIVVRWLAGVAGWAKNSAQDAQTPEENPEPFGEVAREGADRIKNNVVEGIEQIAPLEQDLRLTVCPPESLDPDNAKEISAEKAQALKQEIQSNPSKFTSLMDLQMFLGIPGPACNIKNEKWVILSPNGGIIDAEVKGESVRVTTTNF